MLSLRNEMRNELILLTRLYVSDLREFLSAAAGSAIAARSPNRSVGY